MIRQILNFFPATVIILFAALLGSVLAYLILSTIRVFFPTFVERKALAVHTAYIRILIGIYGIILSFIIILLWQAYLNAQKVVSAEASEFATIVRITNVFDLPTKNKINNSINRYLYTLRYDEWPLMRQGLVSKESEAAVQNIFNVLISIHPRTSEQKTFYQEILNHLNQALVFRRERLFSVNSILPWQLRLIIFMGAILLLIFMCFMESTNRKSHTFMVITLSAVIGAILGIALSLDFPFSGDITVSYDPFAEGILAQFSANKNYIAQKIAWEETGTQFPRFCEAKTFRDLPINTHL
jgi:cytochrome bd-type quinol oxidase subunit 2